MVKHICIIGGYGFLSQHVAKKFFEELKDIEITLFDIAQRDFLFEELSTTYSTSIHSIIGDITKVEDVEKALKSQKKWYSIIHSAGIIRFRIKDEPLLKAVHERGTSNVINVMKSIGGVSTIDSFLFISSVASYGGVDTINDIDETHKPDWTIAGTFKFVYNTTKAKAHKLIIDAASDTSTFPPTTILIPSAMWAPGDRNLSAGVVRGSTTTPSILSGLQGGRLGERIPPGSNCPVDVRDVADAVFNSLSSKSIGSFNITGRTLSHAKIMTSFNRQAIETGLVDPSEKRTFTTWPKFLQYPWFLICFIIEFFIWSDISDSGSIWELFARRGFSSEKAMNTFGYSPKYNINTTARDICLWLKKEKTNNNKNKKE